MKSKNYYLKYEKKISNHLHNIYSYLLSNEEIEKAKNEIIKITLRKDKKRQYKKKKWSEKDSMLICYPDFIKKKNQSLDLLRKFLNQYMDKVFNLVHILPFFPASSDGGFSIIDFFKVDKNFGDWNSIKKISKKFNVMADVVLNHSSKNNKWFLNFLKNEGEGKDFYLYLDKNLKLEHVVRARSHKLLQKFETSKGNKYVWCTFSKDQVDFNFQNPEVLIMFIKIIKNMLNNGVKVFRFDAVAFIWKRKETNCINLDQVHDIIKVSRDITTGSIFYRKRKINTNFLYN